MYLGRTPFLPKEPTPVDVVVMALPALLQSFVNGTGAPPLFAIPAQFSVMANKEAITALVELLKKEYSPCYYHESSRQLTTYEIQEMISQHAGPADAAAVRDAMKDAGFIEEFMAEEGFVYPVRTA
jgi:hypothetical protein